MLAAGSVPAHIEQDQARYFEACLPIEEIARRGRETLRFGPMKPMGLTDPRTGRRPYAVVQLRQENARAGSYNLVGFQNHMRFGEQARVLRMIPGLERAEFLRFGQVHRNTYINGPALLAPSLQIRAMAKHFLRGTDFGRGRIRGVDRDGSGGGSARCGCACWADRRGFSRAKRRSGRCALMFRARMRSNYQPANITFDLLPKLGHPPRDRKQR